MVYTDLTLDLDSLAVIRTVTAVKGDTDRTLQINLCQGKEIYEIPEGSYAVLMGKKADGTILYNACSIHDNRILYTFTEQSCAAVGRSALQIRLYGPDRKLLTTGAFYLEVYPAEHDVQEAVKSKDEQTALDTLVNETRSLQLEILHEKQTGAYVGETGPRGPQGEKGDRGSEGPRGLPGRDGLQLPQILEETDCRYAGALVSAVNGSQISVEDVSPFGHRVECSVRRINLFNLEALQTPDPEATSGSVVERDADSLTLSPIGAHTNGYCPFLETLSQVCPDLKAGMVCTLSGITESYSKMLGVGELIWRFGQTLTVTEDMLYQPLILYGMSTAGGQENTACKISCLQISMGGKAVPYERYVPDLQRVSVSRYGKNLVVFSGPEQESVNSGIVYKRDQKTGAVRADGTAQNQAYGSFCNLIDFNEPYPVPIGEYMLGGCSDNIYVGWLINGKAVSEIVGAGKEAKVVVAEPNSKISVRLRVKPNAEVHETVYPMLRVAGMSSDFESGKGKIDLKAEADGTVTGMSSLPGAMTLLPDTPGVTLRAVYNQDPVIVNRRQNQRIAALEDLIVKNTGGI